MIHNRYLPLWLHRICNGVFGAVLFIGIGSIWFAEPVGTWRHILSCWLIWSGIPVGILLATFTRRCSMVEGVAGGEGYDELPDRNDDKPLA